MFLLPLLMYVRCYGNLKFPLTYNGKSEIGIYYYLIADILMNVFCKMPRSGPLPNITICPYLSTWLIVMATKRPNFRKKKLKKIISPEAILEEKADTLQKYS